MTYQIIQIKRSNTAPSDMRGLLDGELGYIKNTNELFIGTGRGNNPVLINTYSATEKTKLAGIASGAEVNQNAFSNIKVGSTTIAADSKTDSLTLVGSNVTLTPDATNDKVTIGITKENVVSALGYTPPTSNTTYSAGAGLTLDGTTFKHSNSVTAATASGSATKTLTFGGTFALPTVSYDAQGHITGCGTTTMTMPSDRLFQMLVPTGTQIPANADLKTTNYLKVGRYFCASNANAGTLKNCPTSGAFMMEVYSPLSTTIDNETTGTWVYRTRKIMPYNNGLVYVQCCYSDGTANHWTYGDWQINPVGPVVIDSTDTNGGTISVGATNKPVYINSSGVLTPISYTIAKSVPSDAKFTDTTYSVVTSTADGLVPKFDAADGTIDSSSTDWVLTNNNGSIGWYKLPANAFKNDNTNYYHTPSYTTGLKVATGSGIGDLYVPTGTTSSLGVIKQHTSTDCTTYTSDEGATTPKAVKKAFSLFGARNGIFYVAGNTTGTEGTWTGSNTDIPELFTGLTIAYKIGIAGASTTTLTLTTAAGTSEAIAVKRNTGALTTHLAVGSVVHLTYDGTNWVWADYDSNTQSTTNSTNTSSKIFLVGATSQGSNKTTYSHDTVYVGTDGHLYDTDKQVSVVGHTHTVTYAKSATATGSITQGGTNAETSITPAGTVSQPTFTGTAHNHTFTGTAHNHTFTGSSHNHTLTPTTATIKQVNNVGTMFAASVSGEVLILTPGSVPTTANVTVYTGLTIAAATQGGTIANTTATGTIANTTATGTVSKPTFTGTAAKHTHTFTGSAHTHAITLTNTTVTSST